MEFTIACTHATAHNQNRALCLALQTDGEVVAPPAPVPVPPAHTGQIWAFLWWNLTDEVSRENWILPIFEFFCVFCYMHGIICMEWGDGMLMGLTLGLVSSGLGRVYARS